MIALETRSQRHGGNRALAGREIRNAVSLESNDNAAAHQAQRIRSSLHCTEEVARTLARLVYGEGRSS